MVEIRNALACLGIDESEPIAQAWKALAGSESQYAPYRWAHRDGLMRHRPVSQEFRELWADVQRVLDVVLDRLQSRYLATFPLLDDLLKVRHPTRADVEQLRQHAPHNAISLGYFFGRLESARWLEPLRAEGYFMHPPAPVRDGEAGT